MIARVSPAPQSDAWCEAVSRLLGEIDQKYIVQLAAYRDLILASNQQFNLTAIRDPESVDFRLILESLRLLPLLRTTAEEHLSDGKLTDIGSGAGIPGLPLSILQPEWTVVMIEATSKKVRFIQSVIDQLELQNTSVLHGRAEDIGHIPEWREAYTMVVARAVGPLSTLLELSMPLLKRGGRAWFPKGEIEESELTSGKTAAQILGARVVDVAALEPVEGCPVTQVVIADKMEFIPDRYPRRPGIPAKEPLGG